MKDVEIILKVLHESAVLAEQGPGATQEVGNRSNRELAIIADLIEEKFMRGGVLYHQDGVTVRGAAMGGITLKGRLYRDEIEGAKQQKRLLARLGRFAWAVGGWLAGVATALIGALAEILLKIFS